MQEFREKWENKWCLISLVMNEGKKSEAKLTGSKMSEIKREEQSLNAFNIDDDLSQTKTTVLQKIMRNNSQIDKKRLHDQAFPIKSEQSKKFKKFWNPLLVDNKILTNMKDNLLTEETKKDSNSIIQLINSSFPTNSNCRITRQMELKALENKQKNHFPKNCIDSEFSNNSKEKNLTENNELLLNKDNTMGKCRTKESIKEMYMDYLNKPNGKRESVNSYWAQDQYLEINEYSNRKIKKGKRFQVDSIPDWISYPLNISENTNLYTKVWDASVISQDRVKTFIDAISQIKCLNSKSLPQDIALQYLCSNSYDMIKTYQLLIFNPEHIREFILKTNAN